MLNQDTLLLVQVCITLLTTALLVVSASFVECPPEQRWWAAGNVLVSLGLAMTNIDAMPLLVRAVAGYGVLALGLGLVLRGLRVYACAALHWRWIALIVLLPMLVTSWFTYVEPSLRARLCASSFYFAVLNTLCAVVLARWGSWRGVAVSVTGFGLLSASLFMRGGFLLIHADPGDQRSSLVIGICLLAIPLAQVCISFGLILLVMYRYADRLRELSTLDPLTGAL
ncbi:MAG: hypothetical protein ACEQSK_08960 [Sphingomonadaceae bacterium]